jgi:hypothetical protein
MGRRKGVPNKKGTIKYPRECDECGDFLGSAATYSYHKKTHEPIPSDGMCHFGCGLPARYRNTHNKLTCVVMYSKCPAYLLQLSQRTKLSWENDAIRKEQTKQTFIEHVAHNPEARKKSTAAANKRAILKPEDAKNYRAYARKCRKEAQKWAKNNGHTLGNQTYHVDHKLSLLEAYYTDVPVSIVNHPANLRVIEANENVRKGSTSLITLDELLEEIARYGIG